MARVIVRVPFAEMDGAVIPNLQNPCPQDRLQLGHLHEGLLEWGLTIATDPGAAETILSGRAMRWSGRDRRLWGRPGMIGPTAWQRRGGATIGEGRQAWAEGRLTRPAATAVLEPV